MGKHLLTDGGGQATTKLDGSKSQGQAETKQASAEVVRDPTRCKAYLLLSLKNLHEYLKDHVGKPHCEACKR